MSKGMVEYNEEWRKYLKRRRDATRALLKRDSGEDALNETLSIGTCLIRMPQLAYKSRRADMEEKQAQQRGRNRGDGSAQSQTDTPALPTPNSSAPSASHTGTGPAPAPDQTHQEKEGDDSGSEDSDDEDGGAPLYGSAYGELPLPPQHTEDELSWLDQIDDLD